MKTRVIIIVLFFFALYLNSCAPKYVPNVVNMPTLTEKKDFNVSAHVAMSGFDAQGAYAISDNIGIMLNSSYLNSKSTTTTDYNKHIFIETGVGYYKGIHSSFLFDIYGGYGIGKVNSQYSGYFGGYTNNYVNRWFVQPGFAFVCPYFEAAFAPRSAIVLIYYQTGYKTAYFIEPTLTLKLGSQNLKITTQAGYSFMLNNYETSFDYQPIIFSFGLQYSFRGVKSDKKF